MKWLGWVDRWRGLFEGSHLPVVARKVFRGLSHKDGLGCSRIVIHLRSGTIFESNAIARYVARIRRDTELYGATFYESVSGMTVIYWVGVD